MSLAVHIGAGVDSADLTFYRGATGCLFYTIPAWRWIGALTQRSAWMLWLRTAASSFSILCYYWTVQRTDIGIASSMLNLAPVFVIVFSAVFLSERVTAGEIAAMVLAIVSVTGLGAGIPGPVWAVGLAGCVLAAISFTSLRASAQKFSVAAVVWILSIFMMLSALLTKGEGVGTPTVQQLPVVLAVGLFGVVSQFCQTKTYFFLPAPIASALGLTSVLWASGFDVLLFGKQMGPLQVASYAMFIVAMGFLVHLRDKAIKKSRP